MSARTAVDFAVPFSPRTRTPPIAGEIALRTSARRMSSIATTALNGNWVTPTALHPAGIRARRQRRPPDGWPGGTAADSPGFPLANTVSRQVTVAGPPRTRTGVPQQPFRAIVSQRCGRLYGVLPQTVTVTGIGADGWAGLSPRSQAAIEQAGVVVGGPRQLALLPLRWPGGGSRCRGRCCRGCPSWSPRTRRAGLVVLASGDPMFYGIGSTLVRLLGAERVRVLPHPSSVSLAAARLGWPLDDVDVVSLVGRPLALLHPALQPGRRVLALTAETSAAADIRALLDGRGFGASPVTVLADLGGPAEAVGAGRRAAAQPAGDRRDRLPARPRRRATPRSPACPTTRSSRTGRSPSGRSARWRWPRSPRSPASCCGTSGPARAASASSGCGRHPASRAIAVEPRADRRDRIIRNAAALGVPGLVVVPGAAPEALAGLPRPDAVFIGGGVTVEGVVAACWDALDAGGRLVANAVTIEGEIALADWQRQLGGSLTRIAR